MDKLVDYPPISRHMRYALVRNSIVQNGEHQRKLVEIGKEHKRKAEEILHGRSQAVRDHVINTYQAAQKPAANKKTVSRLSISRDRQIMSKINELSDRYLEGPVEKLPQRFKGWKPCTSSPQYFPVASFAGGQPHRTQLTFSHIPEYQREQIGEIFRSASVKNPGNRWRCVTSEQFQRSCNETKLRPVVGSIPRPRALSSGSLHIRRRSCEFSLNSKTLVRLQQLQQRSRLSKTDPSKNLIPNVEEMVIKPEKIERIPGISSQFEKRLENLCSRLANTDAAGNRNTESKWSVVRRHLMAKKLKIEQDATSSDESRALKSNLVTNRRRPSRKRSVRWSDDVAG